MLMFSYILKRIEKGREGETPDVHMPLFSGGPGRMEFWDG